MKLFFKFNLISICFILITGCISTKNSLSNFNTNKTISISEESFKKVNQYFKKEIFSPELGGIYKHISVLYFFLTQDGQGTSIAYCRDFNPYNCKDYVIKYQLEKKCEKLNHQKCFMIAYQNTLIIDGKRINVYDHEIITYLPKFFKILNLNKNGVHSTILVESFADDGKDYE